MTIGIPETHYIEIVREGGILLLMIANPPDNYLSMGFFKELHSFRDLFLSESVDAIVFIGKGNVFSKGVDIRELTSKSATLDSSLIRFGNEIVTFISRLNKPVFAAINGPCLGGGLELSLACHVRLCSEKARFGLPELTIGLLPGLGGIQRLTRVIGEAKALELILLGDIISASKALELHLVSRIFPKKDFLRRVLVFVKTVLSVRKEAIAELLGAFCLLHDDDEDCGISQSAESFIRLISRKGNGCSS